MEKIPFDKKELEVFAPDFTGPDTRPITPRENMELFLRGETPCWMPMDTYDILCFRPRMHPDNYATHLICDADPKPEYASNIAKGWFGLEWQFVPKVGGATVRPGHPMLEDMSDWESVIKMPDLDELDWERSAEINRSFLENETKMREIGCLSGLWERLISLMDVENAAVALIDEEQQEGVHRFFSALCDMYDELIDRYAKYYKLDMLLMHDDWGSQRAPFFSLDTCREMIAPYLKRVVDACRRNGLHFELHSCGKNEALVPAMLDAGVELWCGQELNDFDMLSQKYAGEPIAFGARLPEAEPGVTEAGLMAIAEEFFEKYRTRRVIASARRIDPRLAACLYEVSRKYYAQ